MSLRGAVVLAALLPGASPWHEEHVIGLVPTFPTSQTVTVAGAGSMEWPCCETTQTQAFFSVCNSGFEGQYVMEMSRNGAATDRWDAVFRVHTLQSVTLRGAEVLATKPLWGEGFRVAGGGQLDLTHMRTNGQITLEDGAIALTLTRVDVLYPVALRGGVVRITDSYVTTAGQVLELSPRSLTISGSHLYGSPSYLHIGTNNTVNGSAIESLSISSSTLSNWASWRRGFAHNDTRVVDQQSFGLVRVVDGSDVTLGNVYGDDGDISCRDGWQDEECLTDIDECATDNGLCVQICVNSIGAYRCACEPGYVNVGFFLCLDIDECYTNVDGCSHECRNYDGTYVCDCPDGLMLGEDAQNCIDVNECEDVAICDAYAHSFCANRWSTHDCVCESGYVGAPLNGTACQVDTG